MYHAGPKAPLTLSRRTLLGRGASWALVGLTSVAQATPEDLSAAIVAYTAGQRVTAGRVHMEIAPLVDNGNTIPLTVRVESPMSPTDHVVAIAVFNERNPQREVFECQLGPRAGLAMVSTRIRLATTQKLVAIARMRDGSFWSQTVEVIVTISACLEEA